jgi:hypothetical protein
MWLQPAVAAAQATKRRKHLTTISQKEPTYVDHNLAREKESTYIAY